MPRRLARIRLPLLAAVTLGCVLLGQPGWAVAACADVGALRAVDDCRCCAQAAAEGGPSEARIAARCCSVDAPTPGTSSPPSDLAPAPQVPVAVVVAAPATSAVDVGVRPSIAAPRPVATGPPIWLTNLVLRL